MSEKRSLDVATLFHSMLIAYQMALRDILGSGRAVFVCPVLENFAKITEATGVHLAEGQSLDAAIQNLSKAIKASGLVKDLGLEKLGVQTYIVHVEECSWAREAHKKLNAKHLTCPLVLIVMSIVQAYTENKLMATDSEYSETGTKTRIEAIEP